MQVRTGTGWQTVLADLSLILFMTTAAAVHDDRGKVPPQAAAKPPAAAALPALGEPVAVWSGATGAPPLRDWLAKAAPDPRLRLTILAGPANSAAALKLAGEAGRPARVLIEPDAWGPPLATLTYDQAPLARGLQPGESQAAASAATETKR